MAVGRVVIGALLMLCGVSMVATVLRSRLTIEESKIRFRIVFREEVIPLTEIEGLRTITTGPTSRRVSRRVICVRGRNEPIEIVQFDHDDYLQTWLQQFPHLDQPNKAPVQRVRWVIVAITCMALIGAGILVRTERKNRRLAKRAAAYRILAEQGDAKSQFALGAMYYYGKGLPRDYVEAARWYLKSAEQGDANAQYSLAYMYHDGKGRPQDDLEAARWCRKAAEQGDAKLSTRSASSITEAKDYHRTMQKLCAGTASLPIKVIRRLNTPRAFCITTAMACSGIEFRPTTSFSKLLLTGTRMPSDS